eukprot:TRINITY_DN17982_c0_g1_i4.p1 TRINITY_DN17982_c0_g1~~TRINITY_DN17982_c0_g1_i4.p1  ORF type:complete len:148 (-),score=35.90 TRINITY_DN17982_c0_g1_i4:71-514(-)
MSVILSMSCCLKFICFFFFLMIRRPPRSTQGVSSAASDVYKRQGINAEYMGNQIISFLQIIIMQANESKRSTARVLAIIILVISVVGSLNILGILFGVFVLVGISESQQRWSDWKTPIYVMYIINICLLYTSPSPRDLSTSRMPSSA